MTNRGVGHWDENAIYQAFRTLSDYNDGDSMVDPYIRYDISGIGDLYRSWHALEQAWVGGITLAELIAIVPIDEFDAVSPEASRRYQWSRMLHVVQETMRVSRLSSLLDALTERQNAFIVDPRDDDGPFVIPETAPNRYSTRVPEVIDDFERYAIASAAQAVRISMLITCRLLEDVAKTECVLGLPPGSYQTFQDFYGLLVDSEFSARLRRGEIPLPDGVIGATTHVLETKVTVGQLLANSASQFPDDAHIAHAFGTHLSLIGEHDDAMHYLRKAHDFWRGDVATVYMLVDTFAAVDKPPPISMGQLLSVPSTEAETDLEYMRSEPVEEDPYFGNIDDWQRFLMVRGLRVELGLECPYSVPSEHWTRIGTPLRPTSESSSSETVTKKDFDAGIDTVRMDLAALSSRHERRFARESLLIDELARAMDTKSYATAERNLAERIRPWNKVVPKAQRHLIAAWYLQNDRQIQDFAQAEIVLMSLRTAVEQQLRSVEGIPEQAHPKMHELLELVEHRHRATAPSLVASLRELANLGNQAAHNTLPSYLGDVDRAWVLVLGEQDVGGCFQQLLSLR